MKLFEDSRGFVFAFGFDMNKGKPHPSMICWCDPITKEWDVNAANQAGWLVVPMPLATEFVFENCDGAVVGYQPGLCVELRRMGEPYAFSLHILQPR